MINRHLTESIIEDLTHKMVFVGGPRQVGKTTLALKLVGVRFKHPTYFYWDNRDDSQGVRVISADRSLRGPA